MGGQVEIVGILANSATAIRNLQHQKAQARKSIRSSFTLRVTLQKRQALRVPDFPLAAKRQGHTIVGVWPLFLWLIHEESALLTENEVHRSFRQLFKDGEVGLEALEKAEELLDQLRPESPLRHRLDVELEELRKRTPGGD
jgi:hypothetical protein